MLSLAFRVRNKYLVVCNSNFAMLCLGVGIANSEFGLWTLNLEITIVIYKFGCGNLEFVS